jgi:dynamin 1-like protein
MDILTGKLYPLKLGYIPIVNRSQQDIIADKVFSFYGANNSLL